MVMGSLMIVASAGCDPEQPAVTDGRTTNMNGNDTERLEGYLHGESKYNILPVPAPVNRALATAFVLRHLASALDPDTAGKLARLAIFHDLRDTAEGFLRLLRLGEPTPRDVERTVAAIAALAWLGDAAQVAAARQRYAELLRRDDIEQIRETLLNAAYALGPAEGSAGLQRAVAGAVTALRTRIAELRAPKPPEVVDNLETRIDRLEEFSVREIKTLDRANGVRQAILTEPDVTMQITHLFSLYLEENPQGTRRLSEWAAFRLVRTPDRGKVGAALLIAAERNHRVDPARQKELDLVRGRALRGAAFFEAPLKPELRIWLGTAPDDGTDLLALRPDWEYPPPHSH
jgi:hypothetical protein